MNLIECIYKWNVNLHDLTKLILIYKYTFVSNSNVNTVGKKKKTHIHKRNSDLYINRHLQVITIKLMVWGTSI